jgi:suppressor for copper-sensitivity B
MNMTTTKRLFPLLPLLALALAGRAEAQLKAPEKASFVLSVDRTAYDPGAPAKVAALVSIEHGWHVNSHQPSFEYLIPTVLDLQLPPGWAAGAFVYPAAKLKTFSFEPKPLAVYDGDVVVLAEIKLPKGVAKGTYPVTAALRYQACNDSQCLPPVTSKAEIRVTVGPGGKPQQSDLFSHAAAAAAAPVAPAGGGSDPAPPAAPVESADDSAAKPAGSLALTLLLALFGGLVLNAMPCVLPVLSLKLFGLVRSAGHGRAEVVRGTLATAAGILASFLAMAAAAVAFRAAGAAVGWGVQFQHPGFVAFLAVLVVLFCLNLWGLFEIQLPYRLAQLGGAGAREGVAGHFFSGLFATLMATPCSAPFLGSAVGFALAQTAPVIFAVFLALGLGMALPYLLVAAVPGVVRFLPRPGAWMETVRGAMGFLLAGSAVWLFYVLSSQVAPEQLAAIQLGLLGIALFVWLRHRSAGTPSRTLRGAAVAGVVAAIAVTLFAAVAATGSAGPRVASQSASAAAPAAGLIPWVAFDRARAESLARGGQLVFVDVTANWCFTCKVNERLVLDTPEVAQAFQEHGVVPMRADWTNRDNRIGAFLAEHGRFGIPFYLLYRPGRSPHVFSELPTRDGLVAVVRAAAAGGGRPSLVAGAGS